MDWKKSKWVPIVVVVLLAIIVVAATAWHVTRLEEAAEEVTEHSWNVTCYDERNGTWTQYSILYRFSAADRVHFRDYNYVRLFCFHFSPLETNAEFAGVHGNLTSVWWIVGWDTSIPTEEGDALPTRWIEEWEDGTIRYPVSVTVVARGTGGRP